MAVSEINGRDVLVMIDPAGGSSYVNVAPGTQTFKVLDPTSTAVLDTLDITIAANKRYTVFGFGEVATLSLKMLAAD